MAIRGQKWSRHSRSVARPSFIFLLLGVLTVVGCQAQSADPPTASVAPVGDKPQAELMLASTTAATATIGPDDQVAPLADATKESEMSEEEKETPAATETAPGSDSLSNDGLANADVEFVRAVQSSDGSWTFHVTVRHPDTGWEDYADGWDIVVPDGQVLKSGAAEKFTRLLLHPHENEQPFTRSQSSIVVPDGVTILVVRAHDLIDGFGGRQISVDLLLDSGPDFEVERQ
jgi:hypothetical protein